MTTFETRIERILPAQADDVFAFFVDPERLTTWWPTEAEIDPTPGGRFRFYWDGAHVTLRGTLKEIKPPHRLMYTWKWDHENTDETAVTIDIAQVEETTALILHHTAGNEREQQDHEDGWNHFLDRLETALTNDTQEQP